MAPGMPSILASWKLTVRIPGSVSERAASGLTRPVLPRRARLASSPLSLLHLKKAPEVKPVTCRQAQQEGSKGQVRSAAQHGLVIKAFEQPGTGDRHVAGSDLLQ